MDVNEGIPRLVGYPKFLYLGSQKALHLSSTAKLIQYTSFSPITCITSAHVTRNGSMKLSYIILDRTSEGKNQMENSRVTVNIQIYPNVLEK